MTEEVKVSIINSKNIKIKEKTNATAHNNTAEEKDLAEIQKI